MHLHAGAAAAAAAAVALFIPSSPLVSEVYPRTGLAPSLPCPAPCALCDPPPPYPVASRRHDDALHMYTHAVQSLVFNRCCSFRLAPPNLPAVMLGDLVGVGAAAGGGGDGAEERGPGEVVEVTPENISQYTLADVVLPLPGKDVRYPSNTTGEEYKRVLAELSIQDAFAGSHVKELNLSGAYRRIVCMPQGDQRVLHIPSITLTRPFLRQTSQRTSSATPTTTALCSSRMPTSILQPARPLFHLVSTLSTGSCLRPGRSIYHCWG